MASMRLSTSATVQLLENIYARVDSDSDSDLPQEMQEENSRKDTEILLVDAWMQQDLSGHPLRSMLASTDLKERYKHLWIILFGSQELKEKWSAQFFDLTVTPIIQREISEIKTYHAFLVFLQLYRKVPAKDRPGFFLGATIGQLIGAGVKKVMEAHVDCVAKLPSLKGLSSAWTTLQKFSGK